jgi:hypothetical protein
VNATTGPDLRRPLRPDRRYHPGTRTLHEPAYDACCRLMMEQAARHAHADAARAEAAGDRDQAVDLTLRAWQLDQRAALFVVRRHPGVIAAYWAWLATLGALLGAPLVVLLVDEPQPGHGRNRAGLAPPPPARPPILDQLRAVLVLGPVPRDLVREVRGNDRTASRTLRAPTT